MTYQTIFTLIGTWIVLFLDVIYFGLFWRRSDWRAITKIKWPLTFLLHLDVIAFLVAKTTKTADLYNRSLVVKTIAFLAPFTHLYHGIPPQKWTLSCLHFLDNSERSHKMKRIWRCLRRKIYFSVRRKALRRTILTKNSMNFQDLFRFPKCCLTHARPVGLARLD